MIFVRRGEVRREYCRISEDFNEHGGNQIAKIVVFLLSISI